MKESPFVVGLCLLGSVHKLNDADICLRVRYESYPRPPWITSPLVEGRECDLHSGPFIVHRYGHTGIHPASVDRYFCSHAVLSGASQGKSRTTNLKTNNSPHLVLWLRGCLDTVCMWLHVHEPRRLLCGVCVPLFVIFCWHHLYMHVVGAARENINAHVFPKAIHIKLLMKLIYGNIRVHLELYVHADECIRLHTNQKRDRDTGSNWSIGSRCNFCSCL